MQSKQKEESILSRSRYRLFFVDVPSASRLLLQKTKTPRQH
jgi:hypothetical protein